MKKISILGSTGSIGVSALDVIERNPERFRVVALSAGRNVGLLRRQIEHFKPLVAVVIDRDHADRLKEGLKESPGTEILWGTDGYREIASLKDVDMVVSAIVGAAGLLPTIAAIEAGKDVALANKETMVMAGTIVIEMAATKKVRILPVDSEHSAIFQSLLGHNKKDVRRIILTASGGPFRETPKEQLRNVTLADALRHPKWKMGEKITIDSATMMNKALEIIEARWLFDLEASRIDVIIHPQSIVHSMVEYKDGSIIAQLGVPDMRVPISYALSYPERACSGDTSLDLCREEKLEFFSPDCDKFPALRLAYEAAEKGGTMPVVLNASNEVAVDAFIKGRIGFLDIAEVVEKTMNLHKPEEQKSVSVIIEMDQWGREMAEKIIGRIGIQL
ncbi:MAG: 1-deoxy-D-xylulose-5-phosphate reductoisomerase [Deltaproteobacteria bacterium]|nr:1-deoxy-D-xylulose-5-phosphate reductoisomerase [Deltaproteobacteria bacterium]